VQGKRIDTALNDIDFPVVTGQYSGVGFIAPGEIPFGDHLSGRIPFGRYATPCR
jgi:hypothetical protein